jgi:hypothetical protein
MRRTVLLLVVFQLCTFGSAALACQCFTDSSFVQVLQLTARSPNIKVAVVLGTVEGYGEARSNGVPQAMTVAVRTSLKGDVSEEHIKVWGDDGRLCRPYVTRFPVGTEWVFILQKTREAEFVLGSCGEHWLRSLGNRVVGRITDTSSSREMLVTELMELIAPNPTAEKNPRKGGVRP